MRIFPIFCLMLVSVSAYSHRDTTIELKGDDLVGLPKEYQPAKFDFENLKLTISSKVVVFPSCAKLIFKFSREKLLITASWYHSSRAESLPPYITIGHADNYPNNLLINMNTLEPIPIDWGYGSKKDQLECIGKFKVENT